MLENIFKAIRDFLFGDDRCRGFEFVKNTNPTKLPVRKTKFSACYDFFMPEDVTIQPHGTAFVMSGIKAYMLPDEVLLLFTRSSMAIKKQVTLTNQVAVIDSDYYNNQENEGNIGLALQNNSNKEVVLSKGERVVQGMFVSYLIADGDDVSDVRIGGIGSTK